MKNTRIRNLKWVIALALCLTVLMLLVACGGKVDDSGSCTVVIAEGENTVCFEVPLDELGEAEGAIAALDYLVETGKITYVSDDGGYGAYLTEVSSNEGGVLVKQDYTENRYVYIYTSVERDFDVTSYAKALDYEGVTLTSSGVGISEMSLPDGAIIYITTIVYE